jgi:FkbM family methyltransferase
MSPGIAAWARSALAPEERLLPGLGVRLGRRPRLAAATLVFLRRVPGAQLHVSRPLIRRLATQLEVPVAGGFRMRVDTAEAMGRVLATSGVWEPHVTAAFRATLSPGDVCVDVGAYIGYYTLLAAKLVGPAGHVYALEPAFDAHAALVSNAALNGVSNITTLRAAAGSFQGETAVVDQSIRSTVRPAEAGAKIPVRTVASVVPRAELERLRLVKVDVEGYEVEVLRGVEPIFEAGARPSLLVELHAGVVRAAVAQLAELGARYALNLYVLGDPRFGDLAPWKGSASELAGALEPENERHLLLAP